MNKTAIPWCDYSWNPTSGCNGPNGKRCPYCYAAAMGRRFGRSFAPTCHPEKLGEPLLLKKPARIFADSNGDLFDPAIPDDFLRQVFGIIALCSVCRPQMTFIALTKQARRMRDFVSSWRLNEPEWQPEYPLPNLWLGVTAESQAEADERIPLLLETPAAVHFLSAEPLLGFIHLRGWETYDHGWHNKPGELIPRVNWVIIGADSRPGQPLPDAAWVESIIAQCRAAGVAVWIKGKLHDRWPITEWPEVPDAR